MACELPAELPHHLDLRTRSHRCAWRHPHSGTDTCRSFVLFKQMMVHRYVGSSAATPRSRPTRLTIPCSRPLDAATAFCHFSEASRCNSIRRESSYVFSVVVTSM